MKTLWLQDFIDLLYPSTCSGCDSPLVKGEKLLCLSCKLELPKTNFHQLENNIVERSFIGKHPVQKATSYLYFVKNGIVQSIMHQLKYGDKPEIGVLLGKMAGFELKNSFFKGIDCLIPIPLHPKKLKKRGYNQSERIALGIELSTDIPCKTSVLIRSTFNETQTRKSRFNRWLNVEAIFEIDNALSMENKHVLLIDDVITTGSTIEAAVNQLKEIKGIHISVFTLAFA